MNIEMSGKNSEIQESIPNDPDGILDYFKQSHKAHWFLVNRKWPDGVLCPRCGSKSAVYLGNYHRYQCRSAHPGRQFSLKSQTVMKKSRLPIEKWAAAVWMVEQLSPPISTRALARILGITQKSAISLKRRIQSKIADDSL